MLGLACFNLAEYEASVAAFKMAAAFNAGDNPSAFAALSGMGASLAKLGRFDEAAVVGAVGDPVAGVVKDSGGGVASGWSALRLLPGARRNAAPVTGLTSVNEFARVLVFWM